MIDPSEIFGNLLTTPSEIFVNRYTFLLPPLQKNVDPSEIFLSQPPSEISTWHPSEIQNFRPPSENLVNRGVWILNGMAQYIL
jgi:hypothetical protein